MLSGQPQRVREQFRRLKTGFVNPLYNLIKCAEEHVMNRHCTSKCEIEVYY